jgi:hypothetical protein
MPGPSLSVLIDASAADLTPISLNISSSGVNPAIAGVAGQIIRVWKLFLVPASTVTVQFQDASTNLSGAMSLGTSTNNLLLTLPFDTKPWFTCAAGDAFNINLSGAVQVSGAIYYTQSTG